jgi:hypothetical protein
VNREILGKIEGDLRRRRNLDTDLFCVETWNGSAVGRGHWEKHGKLWHGD